MDLAGEMSSSGSEKNNTDEVKNDSTLQHWIYLFTPDFSAD